jgi:hypothetical protein
MFAHQAANHGENFIDSRIGTHTLTRESIKRIVKKIYIKYKRFFT